jgi:hypothetical protein
VTRNVALQGPAAAPLPFSSRRRVEAAIEALLALLDDCDGDLDLEPDQDGEPSLGAPEYRQTQLCWMAGSDSDREQERADCA